MTPNLTVQVIDADQLTPELDRQVRELCQRAYQQNLNLFFDLYDADAHLVAFWDGKPVAYAMTLTRWLQVGDEQLLRTAYVELVATDPDFQGCGIATALMRRLHQFISDAGYEVGGLSPSETTLYERLGWEYWRGPLFVRRRLNAAQPNPSADLIPFPMERAMILRLPLTPPLDLTQPLSIEWRAGGEPW